MPLPFVLPYAFAFRGLLVWAFIPEYRIVRRARKSARANRARATAGR